MGNEDRRDDLISVMSAITRAKDVACRHPGCCKRGHFRKNPSPGQLTSTFSREVLPNLRNT
jgi:hypothetical protein